MGLDAGLMIVATAAVINVGMFLLFSTIGGKDPGQWRYAGAVASPIIWTILTAILLGGHPFDWSTLQRFWPLIMAPVAMVLAVILIASLVSRNGRSK